ncbi:Uma2 family endonuclease [Actinomadura alba]|uniref:Uma2 family endonuclease n=1 Tax=Actinomadura alba TaxID=406431 RepID=A0ABR7LQ45_9ACTN|nr:Uma2 family endonuclease [Actinomadura alba]MBC6466966.1 Uma2 family endonuclease [Actinomadura alba]
MSAAVAHNVALEARAFTIHDLAALDDGYHTFEVLDGALIVSPSPVDDHQWFADRLRTLLERAAPSGVRVITAFMLRLRDDQSGLIPDILVARPSKPARRRPFYEADEALAVVEVVSRNSRRHDRVTKPVAYAEAGIPYFWRVELEGFPQQGDERPPVIVVHELDGGCYREVERLASGGPGPLTRPFPIKFDPAELLEDDWPERFYGR